MARTLIFALLAGTCAFLTPAVIAQLPARAAAGEEIAFQHAGHLRHGINTSIWFAQSRDYSVERLEHFTTPDDLKLIARLGFDHIRLSVDPAPLQSWLAELHNDPAATTPFVGELDKVIHEATSDGLAVVLDIHPMSDYKATLFQGSNGVDKFTALWRALASRYKNTDPKLVFFEIMNEPEQNDAYRWLGIESIVAAQIHAIAPEHTLIATGAHWSDIPDLLAIVPLGTPNVIYNFHDYDPHTFTHQSATWSSPQFEPERRVPYPSTPDNVEPNLAQEPDLSGKYSVEQYGLDRWDAERIERTIAFAHMWGVQYGVPVYCGEFGVLRDHVEPAARDRWLHDMRVAFEKNGIGWAMWDYQMNFGLVTKTDGKTVPDPGVLKALGLPVPQGE